MMRNLLPPGASTRYAPILFEKYLDVPKVNALSQFFSDHVEKVYWICAAYVITIHAVKHFMKDKEALKLKKLLITWNAILAVFSIWGTCRVSHQLFTGIMSRGVDGYFQCGYRETDILVGFWKRLFGLSKIIELGDTLFIVFRKSKLSFLHWYHHVTVLLYSYPVAEYSARTGAITNVGNWFSGVNFAVHSIMYTYYTMRAAGIHVWRPIAMSITTVQILQMVGGIFVGFYVPWWKCGKPLSSFVMVCTIAMYTSYFLLFCNYFIRAYIMKSKKKAEKKKE